ncbi:MAG: glycoside hydrolase family 3 C-terminal domain-containing protein [Firmicutes bacterium]|nr:glycoside hydrolase family 3 C-terminal domain-containing protein [Bacillota bacterium]
MKKLKLWIKTAWKTKGFKAWMIASSAFMVLLITASIVASSVPLIYGTINSMWGGERRVLRSGDPSQYIRYTADYDSKAEVFAAANTLNESVMEEGIILLKNENEALPIRTPVSAPSQVSARPSITVFGNNSVNLVLGGSGSSAGVDDNAGAATLYSSLDAAGFSVNPVLKNAYENNGINRPTAKNEVPDMGSILTGYPIFEAPKSIYENVRQSYANYNDAALVVVSRLAGEGYDLPRTMFWNGTNYITWTGSQPVTGARSVTDHYLQLDQNETDMLQEAASHFSKVIVIINCATSMELGFLDDPGHYAYQSNIQAALWIGTPGFSGINALGRVLNGLVNPSGKTVNVFARDFKTDPTWNNFGNNLEQNGNRYRVNGQSRNAFFVEYEEGIYVGYRYWETRGHIEGDTPYITDGTAVPHINGTETTVWDNWYHAHVVFPLGFGLSYTNFQWAVTETAHANNATLNGTDEISVTVRVTNSGTVAGKEVVQLYFTAPYTDNGIEKAHVVLGAFGKTKLISAGGIDYDDITLTFNVRNMASYDWNDLNGNDFRGYELDAGEYQVRVMRDSNTQTAFFSYTLPAVRYQTDSATNNPINVDMFKGEGDYIESRGGFMTRMDFDGTWPTLVTDACRETSIDIISAMNYEPEDSPSDPWYTNQMPAQSQRVIKYNRTIKLYELIEKDGTRIAYEDPLWDDFMDQLTVEQMRTLVSTGNFTTMHLLNVDKPETIDADGPMGFAIFMGNPAVYDTAYYASACVVGATWNEELAFKMGEMIGNEGLIGDERGDGRPYSGWYAPGVNIHRSQFGGRNFEYYSEDGLFSGKMASAIIRGAQSKGVYTYLKHFALNDQETTRDANGLITWANEQSMREIYFLPFELAVKEGGTTAIMSAFNRVGTVWAGGDHRLLTRLLREEWGFRGMVITDFNIPANRFMDVNQMIRAGGDLSLSAGNKVPSGNSATTVAALRNASKNILYTVAHSNAMNGHGEGVRFTYRIPLWLVRLSLTIFGVFLLCCALGVMTVALSVKKANRRETAAPENNSPENTAQDTAPENAVPIEVSDSTE